MTNEQRKMIERAWSTLRLARIALQEDAANHAASEAYCAVFHAADRATGQRRPWLLETLSRACILRPRFREDRPGAAAPSSVALVSF